MSAALARPRCALRGVVFDLDGTLTAPHAIDFSGLRRRLGIPSGPDAPGILQYVATLPTAAAQTAAHAVIVEEETRALAAMRLNKGAAAALDAAAAHRLRVAIATRNNADAIDRFRALLNSTGLGHHAAAIDPALARGALCPVRGVVLQDKPHGDPALAAARWWGLLEGEDRDSGSAVTRRTQSGSQGNDSGTPAHATDASSPNASSRSPLAAAVDAAEHAELAAEVAAASAAVAGGQLAWGAVLMVGDHGDDLRCGRHAGCLTCLVTNGEADMEGSAAHVLLRDEPELADFVVQDGHDLAALLQRLATTGTDSDSDSGQ